MPQRRDVTKCFAYIFWFIIEFTPQNTQFIKHEFKPPPNLRISYNPKPFPSHSRHPTLGLVSFVGCGPHARQHRRAIVPFKRPPPSLRPSYYRANVGIIQIMLRGWVLKRDYQFTHGWMCFGVVVVEMYNMYIVLYNSICMSFLQSPSPSPFCVVYMVWRMSVQQ